MWSRMARAYGHLAPYVGSSHARAADRRQGPLALPCIHKLYMRVLVHCIAASSLWGNEGERFKVGGRLLDWSYAGYNAGESPIPDRAPTMSVAAFGARGDGVTDDSAAFQAAIDAAKDGDVLRIPAGK